MPHSNGSFTNESFGYDANGNRNTTGYSTGTGNRLTSDGTYNYSYDDEGHLTSKTKISSGDVTSYTWDYRDRLIEVEQVAGGVHAILASFTYDALDRRIGVGESGAVRRTLFDGSSPILDFDGSGTQTARYLRDLATDEILAREKPVNGVAWYLTDRLGSVGDVIDNFGTVVDHLDYSPFGQLVNETSPSKGDRFKFAQLEYDLVTGLNLAVRRAEDPLAGRWISQDPIKFSS